jgi:hypothetical protein
VLDNRLRPEYFCDMKDDEAEELAVDYLLAPSSVMGKDNQQPKPKPAGNRAPPAPPRRGAVGLGPDGDDSDKKRVTITKAANGEGKFIRQSGGVASHGHVIIRIEPNGRGKGIAISSDVPDGVIPEKYIKPATEGIREALDCGVLDGRPMVDIIVRIVGGSSDEIASNDLAFKMAGIFSIKDAITKAESVEID